MQFTIRKLVFNSASYKSKGTYTQGLHLFLLLTIVEFLLLGYYYKELTLQNKKASYPDLDINKNRVFQLRNKCVLEENQTFSACNRYNNKETSKKTNKETIKLVLKRISLLIFCDICKKKE